MSSEPRRDHIETATDPAAFRNWPAEIYEEMRRSHDNGAVGSVLVSETDDLRVWHLHLAPGERCPFHLHVNPYFWTALAAGRARTYFSDGRIVDMDYTKGQTQHYHYEPGEYMLHSLQNIGDTELVFVTVEHILDPDIALPIPEHLRLTAAA